MLHRVGGASRHRTLGLEGSLYLLSLSFLKISDSPNTKIILVNNGIDNRLIVARQLLHPVESIWRQVVGGSVVPPFFPGSLSRPVPSRPMRSRLPSSSPLLNKAKAPSYRPPARHSASATGKKSAREKATPARRSSISSFPRPGQHAPHVRPPLKLGGAAAALPSFFSFPAGRPGPSPLA
jgi:hypothetical protein